MRHPEEKYYNIAARAKLADGTPCMVFSKTEEDKDGSDTALCLEGNGLELQACINGHVVIVTSVLGFDTHAYHVHAVDSEREDIQHLFIGPNDLPSGYYDRDRKLTIEGDLIVFVDEKDASVTVKVGADGRLEPAFEFPNAWFHRSIGKLTNPGIY